MASQTFTPNNYQLEGNRLTVQRTAGNRIGFIVALKNSAAVTRFFGRVDLNMDNGSVRVFIAAGQTDEWTVPNHDLITEWENEGSLRVTYSSQSIEITLAGQDPQDPYQFTPSNASAVAAFATAVIGMNPPSDGSGFSVRFSIPEEPPPPVVTPLSLSTPNNRSYLLDTTITPFTLPAASDGTSPYTYTLSGQENVGLTFNSVTRQVSGTTAGVVGTHPLIYTVTDADDTVRSATFNITLTSEVTLPEIDDQSNLIDDVVSLTIDEATGPAGPFSYEATGTLPPGVTFNDLLLTFSGTIEAPIEDYSITVRATDIAGTQASRSFTWAVTGGIAPNIGNKRSFIGDNVHAVLPAGAGTGLTYQVVDGTLPNGLMFTAGNRTVAGTVEGPAGDYVVRYIVTEPDGDSEEMTFSWEVAQRAVLAMGTVGTPYLDAQVRVGVPYMAELSLPQVVQATDGSGSAIGEPERIAKVTIGTYRSHGGMVGSVGMYEHPVPSDVEGSDAPHGPLAPIIEGGSALRGLEPHELNQKVEMWDPPFGYEHLLVLLQDQPQPFSLLFIEMEMQA